jgi:NADPH:quinone reductase-like Zn-dependent oxidoreductase
MKAVVIHKFGPPDVLQYQDVPDPQPRAGEIRVKVHAATVNRVLDVGVRAGKRPEYQITLPLILGVDCAGIVDAVGPNIKNWHKGDRVAAAGVMPLDPCDEDCSKYTGPVGMMGIKRPGGFAEMVNVAACAAIAVPDGLNFQQAAVVMRHAPTAWKLLTDGAELKPNETVLIMGAAGNLGSIGIQIAKNVIGATVIAAAGSDERVKVGLDLGADHGVNYNKQDIHAEVMRITGGKGVNVLYDNIANPNVLPQAFRTLAPDGRMVTAGSHGGPNVMIDFKHLYHNKITIKGMTGSADRALAFAAAAAGKIKAQIEKIMPLSQVREAHRFVESGKVKGKIVLDPTLG